MSDSDVDDRDIRSTIDAFEAARTARQTRLPQPTVQRILLVLDGSNQDGTAEAFARALAQRSSAELQLHWAYPGPLQQKRQDYVGQKATALEETGISVSLVQRPPEESRNAVDQILAALAAADLAVICAPYQEDFEELGQESVGSTLDMLLGRTQQPVLAVREPKLEPENCLRRALLPLTPILQSSSAAAAWALFLAQDGEVELLAISPEEPDAEESAPQKVIASLRSPEEAGLVAAIQRRAAETNIDCRVDVQRNEGLDPLAAAANRQDQVVVIPCSPRQHGQAAYLRMLALLRVSRNPLLVI